MQVGFFFLLLATLAAFFLPIGDLNRHLDFRTRTISTDKTAIQIKMDRMCVCKYTYMYIYRKDCKQRIWITAGYASKKGKNSRDKLLVLQSCRQHRTLDLASHTAIALDHTAYVIVQSNTRTRTQKNYYSLFILCTTNQRFDKPK